MTSILDTGKDGYDIGVEFRDRTKAAFRPDHLPWPDNLFEHDVLEVLPFIESVLPVIAPLLAARRAYRLIDLACGFGKLAPFLAGFDCAQYEGIDSIDRRIEYATERYATRSPRIAFTIADVLALKPHPRWDVVWCSFVMQHLTIPDKRRFVETMKAARAPGGICLLREDEIRDVTGSECERLYARPEHAWHMIPTPLQWLATWFEPLRIRPLGGNVYRVSED